MIILLRASMCILYAKYLICVVNYLELRGGIWSANWWKMCCRGKINKANHSAMWLSNYYPQCMALMAHAHCTGPGTGTGQGQALGTMGLYIMLCTVHTTQGQGQGQGQATDGFQTHFNTGSCTR